jgi:hypothetical protein
MSCSPGFSATTVSIEEKARRIPTRAMLTVAGRPGLLFVEDEFMCVSRGDERESVAVDLVSFFWALAGEFGEVIANQ